MKKTLSYLLWPLLFAACVIATVVGIQQGHGILVFNVTYLMLAATLFALERVMPHERQWLADDRQMGADLSHTLLNKGVVQMIIVFTTLSGAGYGLLFWLGLLSAAGLLPPELALGLAAFGLALASVSAGLLASTLHLGHPERSWRALSQWRSSWLSREGVAALATYLPTGLFALGWVGFGESGGIWAVCALLAALGAVITVTCTAYIYRSLKPIQRWANGWVLPNYLALAAMTGALWLAALAALFDRAAPHAAVVALAAIFVAAPLKLAYWRFIDRSASASTSSSRSNGAKAATGPNVSSRKIAALSGTSASTVGSKKFSPAPCTFPPLISRAPLASASATCACCLATARALISGPMSGSVMPGPTVSRLAFSAKAATKRS